jgi:hypothetical protein
MLACREQASHIVGRLMLAGFFANTTGPMAHWWHMGDDFYRWINNLSRANDTLIT